jgi:hypothetical protein
MKTISLHHPESWLIKPASSIKGFTKYCSSNAKYCSCIAHINSTWVLATLPNPAMNRASRHQQGQRSQPSPDKDKAEIPDPTSIRARAPAPVVISQTHTSTCALGGRTRHIPNPHQTQTKNHPSIADSSPSPLSTASSLALIVIAKWPRRWSRKAWSSSCSPTTWGPAMTRSGLRSGG